MDPRALLTSIIDHVRDDVGVATVYGTPVERGEKTVIPAAKVAYGFGGGYRSDAGENDESSNGGRLDEFGGGLGGGVRVTPTGVVEVTDDETRFVPVVDAKKRLLLAGAVLLLGYLLGRRSRGD